MEVFEPIPRDATVKFTVPGEETQREGVVVNGSIANTLISYKDANGKDARIVIKKVDVTLVALAIRAVTDNKI